MDTGLLKEKQFWFYPSNMSLSIVTASVVNTKTLGRVHADQSMIYSKVYLEVNKFADSAHAFPSGWFWSRQRTSLSNLLSLNRQ